MKHIARKWMAIAMAIALVFGCALAEADALFEEGKAAYDAGDYATALEKLTQVAEDNPAAQVLLGDMYCYGYGVDVDPEKAVEFYQRAADAGYADGKAELGLMYAKGNGVEQDSERAVALYNEAAEGGSERGRTLLAEAYLTGDGVEQDIEKGLALIEESFANGYADAKTALALHYLTGEGVEQDQQLGLELLMEAASAGSTDAQMLLASFGISFDSAPDAAISTDDSGAGDASGENGAVEASGGTEDVITEKSDIRGAQWILNSLGYDCGTPDGIIGDKTRAAISQFQEDNGLAVTGALNLETATALAAMVS